MGLKIKKHLIGMSRKEFEVKLLSHRKSTNPKLFTTKFSLKLAEKDFKRLMNILVFSKWKKSRQVKKHIQSTTSTVMSTLIASLLIHRSPVDQHIEPTYILERYLNPHRCTAKKRVLQELYLKQTLKESISIVSTHTVFPFLELMLSHTNMKTSSHRSQ
jgi:hypothetical protein